MDGIHKSSDVRLLFVSILLLIFCFTSNLILQTRKTIEKKKILMSFQLWKKLIFTRREEKKAVTAIFTWRIRVGLLFGCFLGVALQFHS